jgi:hypothetical protein
VDADPRELVADPHRPPVTAAAHLGQARDQRLVGRIDPQADDVQGLVQPRHRYLDPGTKRRPMSAASAAASAMPSSSS